MRRPSILFHFLIGAGVLAAPIGAGAQSGWVVGINPGFVHQAVVPNVMVPNAIVGNPTPFIQAWPGTPGVGGAILLQPQPLVVLTDPGPGARLGADLGTLTPPSVYSPSGTVYVNKVPVNPINPYVYGPAGTPLHSAITPAVNLGRNVSGGLPAVTPGATVGIDVGMPRTEVIRLLGRPSATIYRASGRESLFFTHATVIIENGVVAVIQ